MDTCSLSSGFRIATFLAAESLSSVGLLELVVGWVKCMRASGTQPWWQLQLKGNDELVPSPSWGRTFLLGPTFIPLALLTITLAVWGLQATNAWRLIRWQAIAQTPGRSPVIISQFKGTSRRLTALTVATTLCTLALVFLAVNNSPYHQPQQNIQLFISAAALLTGCLLVGMQGAAAAGALCTSYSFLHRQQRSSTFSARGRGQQLSQRSRIHHLRNGPLTTSTHYDPAKHKSYRLIVEPPPAGDKQLGSPPVPRIPSSPFAVSTDGDMGKSLQRTKAPTAEMAAEVAFERHASQLQVNRGEDGGGRPRHMHDKLASGTVIDGPDSEAAPPQTPAPVASSKPRHTDLHARLSAAYAPTASSMLASKSRSDDAAADLLHSMQDPYEHRRTMEATGDGEEEAHRNPLLFFANEDKD